MEQLQASYLLFATAYGAYNGAASSRLLSPLSQIFLRNNSEKLLSLLDLAWIFHRKPARHSPADPKGLPSYSIVQRAGQSVVPLFRQLSKLAFALQASRFLNSSPLEWKLVRIENFSDKKSSGIIALNKTQKSIEKSWRRVNKMRIDQLDDANYFRLWLISCVDGLNSWLLDISELWMKLERWLFFWTFAVVSSYGQIVFFLFSQHLSVTKKFNSQLEKIPSLRIGKEDFWSFYYVRVLLEIVKCGLVAFKVRSAAFFQEIGLDKFWNCSCLFRLNIWNGKFGFFRQKWTSSIISSTELLSSLYLFWTHTNRPISNSCWQIWFFPCRFCRLSKGDLSFFSFTNVSFLFFSLCLDYLFFRWSFDWLIRLIYSSINRASVDWLTVRSIDWLIDWWMDGLVFRKDRTFHNVIRPVLLKFIDSFFSFLLRSVFLYLSVPGGASKPSTGSNSEDMQSIRLIFSNLRPLGFDEESQLPLTVPSRTVGVFTKTWIFDCFPYVVDWGKALDKVQGTKETR